MSARNYKFEPLEEPMELEVILKGRVPLSTNVYNVMRLNREWRTEQKWYTLGDRSSENDVWVMVVYQRKDVGQTVSISRPTNVDISPELRQAFSHWKFLDWGQPFVFLVDPLVSSLITSISVREKGNWTQVHPCTLYTMDPEQALKLPLDCQDSEVKSLDVDQGLDFIMKTWKFASPAADAYIRKCLTSGPSAGVYVKGEVVASATFDGQGLIGMLYVLPEHRRKGYGKLAMHYMLRKTAENHFLPGCTVALRNDVSRSFQEKIGFRAVAELDYVVCEKMEFE